MSDTIAATPGAARNDLDDAAIESAAAIIKPLSERTCERIKHAQGPGRGFKCREYWKDDLTQWCTVCIARQWIEISRE